MPNTPSIPFTEQPSGDFFLELFSEEIPARLQGMAALALKTLVLRVLDEHQLIYCEARSFATPRRLAVSIRGIPHQQPEKREERRGPRVGSTSQAIDGFLKSVGLTRVEDLKILRDSKKGDFYAADIIHPRHSTIDVLSAALSSRLEKFPWPKSMRWGTDSRNISSLRWIRPLHTMACTFSSPDTQACTVIPLTLGSIISGRTTYGHRFLAPHSIEISDFTSYQTSLESAFVVLDAHERQHRIWTQAQECAHTHGLEVIEDPTLLEEVAGLVEWPCVFMGQFDRDFLQLPTEVIRLTARHHQKCFLIRDPNAQACTTQSCTNAFILVANHSGLDDGKTIVSGNERVIAARLHDALFFWNSDLKTPLESHLKPLEAIIFHDKLGTQAQRVERIADLARTLALATGADPHLAERAARLAKADLTTKIVSEFPELQGIMGGIYAAHAKEHSEICEAIRTHYKPQGPSDSVPTKPVSVAVALADKIDLLASFWWAGERPSGTRDPYALRRNALGLIRLILVNKLSISWTDFVRQTWRKLDPSLSASHDHLLSELRSFLNDRLSVYLEETEKYRYDVIRAVMESEACRVEDNSAFIATTVGSVSHFMGTPEGEDLLALYRRATHILEGEEKRDQRIYGRPLESISLEEATDADRSLYNTLTHIQEKITDSGKENLSTTGVLKLLAKMRPAIDAFFDTVLINDPNPQIRTCRLELLSTVRYFCHRIADFSKIVG